MVLGRPVWDQHERNVYREPQKVSQNEITKNTIFSEEWRNVRPPAAMTVDLPIEDPVYDNRMRTSSIRAPPRGVQEVIKGRNLPKKLLRTECN